MIEAFQVWENLSQKLKILWNLQFDPEKRKKHFIITKFLSAVNVFIVSLRNFIQNDCFTKASSIAYTTIISLIPTLTVAITFYSIFSGVGNKKDEIFRQIALFIQEHNIKLNLDSIFDILSSLIDNAGKIGGIGAVVMVFSATAVLRTMEKSLDDIFQVKMNRAFFRKIIYYWTALTLGPIMLIAGTAVTSKIYNLFSAPNYSSAYVDTHTIWAVGNKGAMVYNTEDAFKLAQLTIDRIDFENQDIYRIENDINLVHDDEFKYVENDVKSFVLNDIFFIGERGWCVGNDGLILKTLDGGKKWFIEKLGNVNLNKITMINEQEGFIAGENGSILKTQNSGLNWEIARENDFLSSFYKIAFFHQTLIAAGERGSLAVSKDRGKTFRFSILQKTKKKNRYLNMNDIFMNNEKNWWVVGNEGLLLFTLDGGEIWQTVNYLDTDFTAVYFQNSLKGFLGDKKGNLYQTEDGGKKWNKIKSFGNKISQILFKNNQLWVVGENGMVMSSLEPFEKWGGTYERSFVLFLLNFLAPFFFIWILFLIIYISLPSIKIPFKPAAIGAAFTSTVWVVFILLFGIYVNSFANSTFAVYGALASIPIFLLLIYSSSLILLYGAEVSHTLMHPHLYRNPANLLLLDKPFSAYHGIYILYLIYKKFESGKGSISFKEIAGRVNIDLIEIEYFIKNFEKQNMILKLEKRKFIPSRPSSSVELKEILETAEGVSWDHKGIQEKEFMTVLDSLVEKLTNSKALILENLTLKDFLQK